MAKYNVLITAEATVSTIVTVEADSIRDAEQLALDKANDGDCQWELDDGNIVEPYLCDPGNCAELETETA